MAMSDAKKQKLEESLRKSGAIAPTDKFIDAGYANHVPLLQRTQPGFACFTEEKFIWTGAGSDIVIPYSQIQELGKCLVMLMPMGIKISYQPTPGGKIVKKKFSIWKRNSWLAMMAEKAKVPCP
ncbi:MAG: hypothetical protein K2P20_06310 [Oscillospiraceae bacterium]|nr:hypothetical protein [Oscillospiraceae bacterium]